MSIGNHLSETVRQLWASLTGGWYYEPANSIFCNTLHFYIWCILLILPFLIGIVSSNGVLNFGWIFAYILFIFVLFSLLKIIVGYLNNVFDVVEPIITHKKKRLSASAKSTNLFRNSLSSFSARATESNGIEMIDFIADQSSHVPVMTDDSIMVNSNSSLNKASIEKSKHPIVESSANQRRGPLPTHGSLASCQDTTQHMRLLDVDCTKQASTGLLRSADSLELLSFIEAISSNSKRSNNNLPSHSAIRRTLSCSRRKYSDPYAGFLTVRRYPTIYRRVDERSMPIRRVHSTGNRINSIRSLTRDTMQHASGERRQAFERDTIEVTSLNGSTNILQETTQSDVVEAVGDSSQEPCCSRSLMNKPIEVNQSRTSKTNQTSIKRANDISLESQEFFTHSKDAKTELSIAGSDLKGEITKFLEELIEKHPETLDAIENVRMNRLGRVPLAENTLNDSVKLESSEKQQSIDLIIGPSSSDIYPPSMGDGTHIAYDHEDTSQGAVHSFQDEHGNWWTYAFDDQSSGMAQVLGSSRAISATLSQRRRNRKVSGSKSMNLHFKSNNDQTNQIVSYVNELNGKAHSSYHALNFADSELHNTNSSEEMEITPKVEVIEVLSRSGRHIPHQGLKHGRKCRQSASSLERKSEVIVDRNDASSSSGSLSSSSYDSPLSTSTSEGSDEVELSRYIADRPAAMFRPSNSGTANIERFRHSGELGMIISNSMRHNRFFSDSVFTSFLNKAAQNPLCSALSGGLSSGSGGYRSGTLRLDSTTNENPDKTITGKSNAEGASNQKNSEMHPHHRRRTEYVRKSRENEQNDSNVMEHYYKHLRRHHRRNRDNQRRVQRVADPRTSLRALELLQSGTGHRAFPFASADVGAVGASPTAATTEGNAAVSTIMVHPSDGPTSSAAMADNLSGRINSARFNVDAVETDWRNVSRDSGESMFSVTIANDAVLARNNSAGVSIRRDLRSLSSMRILNDLQSIGISQSCLRANGVTSTSAAASCRTKVNYHYCIKLLPRAFFAGDGFRLQIDRLSLSALFDRNFAPQSAFVDVVLSTLVAVFAAALATTNVYSGLTLPLFAFVVAGSQFSLLKSVQPDAASPVHGFNWLIAYSRPVYFCLLALLFFAVDWCADRLRDSSARVASTALLGTSFSAVHSQSNRTTADTPANFRFVVLIDEAAWDVGWMWSASWLHLYSDAPFFFSLKTLISTSILFLPIMFTLGLLPQIDTMAMHVLEQVDVHIFGATASFSLLSAVFSCARSIGAVATLAAVGRFARHFDTHVAPNVVFSAFVASTVSAAFLASRWSTNPLIYRLTVDHLRRWFAQTTTAVTSRSGRHRQHRRRRQNNEKEQRDGQKHQRRSSSASNASVGSEASAAAAKPFIKSFCCTAKFTSKPNIVEILTAPKAPLHGGDNEPAAIAVGVEEAEAAYCRSNSLNSRNAISLNIHFNDTDSKAANPKDRRSSMTSTVSAPDRSICLAKSFCPEKLAYHEGSCQKPWAKTSLPIQSAAEMTMSERSADLGRSEPVDELPKQQCSESSDRLHGAASKPRCRRSLSTVSSRKKTATNSGGEQKIIKLTDDTLPTRMRRCVVGRLYYDIFYVTMNTLLMFGIHSTTLFTSAQPYLEVTIMTLCAVVGIANHYLYPHLRRHTPWKLLTRPVLRAHEFGQHETVDEARLTAFERLHAWLLALEKTLLYPLLIISLMTTEAWRMPFGHVVLTALCGFRIARSAFSQPQLVYGPLLITGALHFAGLVGKAQFLASKLFVLYVLTAVWPKLEEFALKLNFIFVYIAPWQISWGSAFHAFAQPFSVPHTGVMCAQAALSSLLSAPLNPFLGSSFFLMSYVRPLKFWEKDYNTKRVDHSNLRLISQLDRGPMLDDSNLNAIFYEHLTYSLQKWLAGDLLLGRWATAVQQGDYFILTSLYINCLVHIIEVGNGFVTFQVRGLEFRGTYCHQREVEAISEDVVDGGDCCCCTIGKISGLLSFNNAWSMRWLAWEVVSAKYIIDGYSITDNSAVNLLQVHELRRLLVTLYVKCIIYYAITAPNFDEWLTNETVLKVIEPMLHNPRFTETDPIFCHLTDEDYDFNVFGISKTYFTETYSNWIKYCWNKRCENSKTREMVEKGTIDLNLVTCFSFALSVLGRRALSTASFNRHVGSAESFLFGLHALLKGDMRITSPSDEWVFTDPEILTAVISAAVRMSLKLHQDHFLTMDEFEDVESLYDRIREHQSRVFISHEHDPAWRAAIIANTPSLLALRHIFDDGQDDYKIIMLNRMALNMRVIKLNRECVRAFWSGQQQELIFLRNRNPERGSIQNARQVLRNMINSSADQPIGYPIYVSPLVTSFVEMHPQMNEIFGEPPTFCGVWRGLRHTLARLRHYIGASSASSSNWQQGSRCGDGDAPAQSGARSTFMSSSSRNAIAVLPPSRDATRSGGQQSVVGPSVSPAGSTPAPYRKHAGGQNQSIGCSASGHQLPSAVNRRPAHSSAPPSISTSGMEHN